MARRNIEGAGNEMLKASKGRVCVGTPIRVLSSVMSSSCVVRGGIPSERCLGKHPYPCRRSVNKNTEDKHAD